MEIGKGPSNSRTSRFLLFKAMVGIGVLLGLLLLVQSIVDYHQVSGELVSAELLKEARQHLTTIQRELNRETTDAPSPGEDPERLQQLFEGLREQEPNRFAWIRLVNGVRQNLVSAGTNSATSFTLDQFLVAYDRGAPVTKEVETPKGRALVFLFAVRLTRRPLSAGGGRDASTASGPRASSRFVEMALYWESASQSFQRLRRDLVISSAAAIGLVTAMVLIWLRFPHYLHGVQLQEQTAMARRVQEDLLPPPGISFEVIELSAVCQPAWEVGGDFYDAFTAENGKLALLVGDVSGKGVPASMVMSLIVGAIRTSSWTVDSRQHEDATARLSEFLRIHASESRFASMFWCYYDPKDKILRYINAGHLPPILIRSSAAAGSRAEEAKVCTLSDGGAVLGILSNPDYSQREVKVEPGDLLVLYTDGVVEASDENDAEFGEQRLLEVLLENASKPSAEIQAAVLRKVQEFLGRRSAQDDLTLVVARFKEA